ncbi:MAG: NUDIX hydrolase [Gammaproteobacteria bacterium]|nr:NUDIX hydrolase [Gammaproteobacteria bacterium]MCW8839643.1 NUDIX hydrolase [Gammaproteobacteria bacterium]MCW8928050.1 NUDIX hydrolase [Gammaproteobacteria bacterium]MCW8958015.1 NUDIX hydrolase [Gammaproteobacteria bacterium]MCW8973474.1 NUDIX hydrolase [Gammaproteobacteria bacterium]
MPRPVTPLLAADIIIEPVSAPGRIILIERRNPPHGFALPGGFVDVGESLEQAAVREALEETAMEVTLKELLGCYSSPDRDPRGHTVSAVYIASGEGDPEARDDAKSLQLIDPKTPPQPLAFDHAQILQDYLHYLESGQVTPLR